MSISEQFKDYKDLIADHPTAVCYDVPDALGGFFRYHRDGDKIFAAVVNRKGQFESLLKDLKLH